MSKQTKNLVAIMSVWVAMFFISGCASVPTNQIKQNEIQKIHSIAVLTFTDAPGADAGNSGGVVAASIGSAVLSIPRWRLVDKSFVQNLTAGKDINRASSVELMRLGNALGVDAIIVGNVSQFEIGSIPFLFFLAFDKNVYRVSYSLRMVDMKNGSVCWSGSTSASAFTSLEDAARRATDKLFEQIRQMDLGPLPAELARSGDVIPLRESFFDPGKNLVVKNLEAQKGIDLQTTRALSEVVKNTLADYCSVQSLDALAAVNSLVEEKLKAGCDDTQCIIEVAGAMDISQVVTGNISKLGNTYMLSLMLIQTKGDNLGVIKRASEECQCTEEELIGMVKRVAAKLMQ